MEAIVIGGGPAGAATARTLALLSRRVVRRVIVVERACDAAGVASELQPALGLWPRAWESVRTLLGDGAATALAPHGMPPACYRDLHGRVLSHCSHTDELSTFVRSVRTSALVEALLDHEAIEVRTNAEVIDVASVADGARVRLALAGGATLEADAAIAAAGSRWDDDVASDGGDVAATSDDGWTTIGGVLDDEQQLDRDATAMWRGGGAGNARFAAGRLPYETLAPRGRRFAVVPLAGRSLFWFATVATRDVVSRGASAAEAAQQLPALFEGVRNPLDRAIAAHAAATAGAGIYVHRTAASESRPLRTWTTELQPTLLRVGEASNAAGHSLAQGASLAIEDAAALGRALGSVLETDGLGLAWPTPRLAKALLDGAWRQERERRLKRHHFMTRALEIGTACDSAVLARVRDVLLSSTPRAINTRVFDAALRFSLN